MADIILHHYDVSPFSEKVRMMLGIKGLSWASVIQPVIMPKPDLTPLTGGYRRIPVMQIGADVYCDSQVILAELEARNPTPPVVRPGDWAVNLWADRLWFQATVPVVFAGRGGDTPAEFIADREKLSGRPFDVAGMQAAAPFMRGQWRAMAAWIEQGLAEGHDFLGGSTPSLADIASYMNVWWLNGSDRDVAEALLDGMPLTKAWRARMREIGHGSRVEMSPTEALAAAKAATPAAAPAHDPHETSGVRPGEPACMFADDYGRDPLRGTLVAATASRIIIAREDPAVGRVHVHAPRVGFHLTPDR